MQQAVRGYLLLSVICLVSHLLGTLLWFHDSVQRNFSLLGAALCLLSVYTLAQARKLEQPQRLLQRVDSLAFLLSAMWLVVDTSQDMLTTGKIGFYSLADLGVLSVIAFNIMPSRIAILSVTLAYGVLSALYLASGSGDAALLLTVGVMVALTGLMSVFGRQLIVQQAHTEWLRQLAYQDPVTGIASRRIGEDTLSALEPQPGSVTALVMLDIDSFKQINDTLGHLEGDRVLRLVAQGLQAQMQPGELVCRWGGEEFLLILSGPSAERLQERTEAMRRPRLGQGARLAVTTSIGGALLGEGKGWRDVLALADRRLYVAKDRGRNQAVWQG